MTEPRFPFLNLATVNAIYRDDLLSAAKRVINGGRYIGGEEVSAFNRELAGLCDAPYAIGVSNGLDALRLIFEGYKVLGLLKKGDEIIIPANTYIASVLAVTHSGLTPILVDPDEHTMNLSADSILKALSPRTRAIMPVHLYGRIAWSMEMKCIAEDHDLLVIEDAAQAIGAEAGCDGMFSSRKAAAIGHAGAFSFYPTKNVGALGDAGAVVTHNKALADAVNALANYGSDRRYHNIYAGFNCRLDPIQAAMLRAKLSDLSDCNHRRQLRAESYDKNIDNPFIIKPALGSDTNDCVWHQYVLRISDGRRDEFISYLTDNGVGTDIHYAIPPHLQPCYTNLAHMSLPVTEQLANEIVSLPISDCTSIADTVEISNIINRFK